MIIYPALVTAALFNNRPPVVVVNGRRRPEVERRSKRSLIDLRAVPWRGPHAEGLSQRR
jgi:hypothetical protein